MHHYLMSGLDNVYLKNGYTIVTDEEHGVCISITNADTLHKCIVRSLVSVERRLSFAELDFLRKAMDMDTKAFFISIGSVCGITPWISVSEECLFRMIVAEKLLRLKLSPSTLMESIQRDGPISNMYFELKTIWKRTNESSCV